uniref:Uncharacterized protein n=1 Tax=Myotis myotis TaxID=51298 RepID=A0A7J8ALT2_MYOMY|nr:hypothetical protein mMyoMyo1_008029 [Myotis myotis]
MRYLWRKFQFHCFVLALLFFSQIHSVECLKAFLLFFSFCYVVYIYIFPFHVEAVPIFLVLFLTPGCDQQYLPLSPFFYLLSFSYFLLSFPFTSSLPLINPCSSRYIVTPIKIHFSLFFKPNLFFNITQVYIHDSI